MLNWLITILRAWLGIRADIAQKQAERAGEMVQVNSDLKQQLMEAKADEKILSGPARSDASIDADLMRHAPRD